MSDALKVPLKGWVKPVWSVLAWHANDKNKCWPSLETIALEAGCCKRTAQDAINELENEGLIKIDRSNGRSSHVYHINGARAATLTVHGLPPKERERKEIYVSCRDEMPEHVRRRVELSRSERTARRRRTVQEGYLSFIARLDVGQYVTVPALAKDLGMSPATVRNDLDAIFRTLDIPYEDQKRLRKSERKPAHWGRLRVVSGGKS